MSADEPRPFIGEEPPPFLPPQPEPPQPPQAAAPDINDRELLELALRSRNGSHLAALWRGEWMELYPTHSEADLALAGTLAAHAGPDPERIDRLFRRSGLMRAKWDEAHASSTYGADTIARAIAATRNVYQPPHVKDHEQQAHDSEDSGGASLAWVKLSSIAMKSIVFADRPLLQTNAFHLFVGRKGVGKGTCIAGMAARVTRGELGSKRGVVWIASEDSAAIDIKPRVIAARGDPERIAIVTDWLQLPRDVDKLRNTITEVSDVGLVVIDPVGNHITGKNSNAETDIRDAIAPLNALADEFELILLGVRHLTEKEASLGVLAAILGSSAWVQVPRAVVAIVRDDEDPEITHVQCVAGNRVPPNTPGRMFRIVGVKLDGLENEVTRADWLGDSSKDVETLLERQANKKTSRSDTARELLLDALEAAPGMQMESDALDAHVAASAGISVKTVKNLRTELKDAGLLRPIPIKDELGTIDHWIVARTFASRQIPTREITTQEPDPDSRVRDLAGDLELLAWADKSDEEADPGWGTNEEIPLGDEPAFDNEDPGEQAPLPPWVLR